MPRRLAALPLLLLSTLLGAAQPDTPLAITVPAGARQVFQGLGVSTFNNGAYTVLAPERRALLARLIYRDLRLTTLRIWWAVETFAPERGQALLAESFADRYVKSGLIAEARAHGMKTILLGPEKPARWMLTKPEDGNSLIKDEEVGTYVAQIAILIQRLRDEHHTVIDATGIGNEPPWFTPAQMATAVRLLRGELDQRGLQAVKIVAHEGSNNDATGLGYLDALIADPLALAGLTGFATHSYNMAARAEEAERVQRTGKEFWITESGGGIGLPETEQPVDAPQAASAASRFLNDMNHRATHWIWFLGAMDLTNGWPEEHDNVQRLIEFRDKPGADWYLPLLKYYYLKRLAQTFDVGCSFRAAHSSLEGDMTWTYGRKPQVTAAAALNLDGTWGIGAVNYTSNLFTRAGQDEFNRTNTGQAATDFRVTITIAELAAVGDQTFTLQRTSATHRDVDEGEMVMHDGVLAFDLAPLELVTLRQVRR